MPGSMLILTWVGIIFVKILHFDKYNAYPIIELFLNSIDIINYNRLLVYIFILVFALGYNVNEKFEDTKGVIRSRKSKIPKG